MDDDRALRAEVVDSIKDSFYKPVKDSDIDQNALKGIVAGLGDQFSNYLTPEETKEFEESVQGEFEGVGMNVDEDRRGLQVINVFDGTPAKKGGIKKGDFITEVNGALDRGRVERRGHRPHQGRGRHEGAPRGRGPRHRGPPHAHARRARIEVPVAESKLVDRGGQRYGVVELTTFSSGAHGRLRREIDKVHGARGEGHRARPARQRRRAAAARPCWCRRSSSRTA